MPFPSKLVADADVVEFTLERLVGVHDSKMCMGERCVIHNRSRHHMSDFQLSYRWDRGIWERTCSHGVGHPDPDQSDYWLKTHQESQDIHGCDGCCRAQS